MAHATADHTALIDSPLEGPTVLLAHCSGAAAGPDALTAAQCSFMHRAACTPALGVDGACGACLPGFAGPPGPNSADA